MDDEQGLQAAVRALAAESRRTMPPHPSPDELLDYHAGDLAGQERERLQDHLALCPECARAVLDLASFPDVAPACEEERLTEFDVAAERRRFRQSAGVARPPRRDPSWRFASPRFAYALAASLLLAVAGLSLWVGRLHRELSAPRADVYVADLIPRQESVERSAAEEETVLLPAWANRLLLILNLAEAPSYPEYRVEIAAPDGETVWSRRGVHPAPDGNFTLEVPRRLLVQGRYGVRLLGLRGNAWSLVAEYGVRIQGEE